jgi:hypothetical protein
LRPRRDAVSPADDHAPDEGFNLFFFFSNRLGCLGSLLLSAAVSLILLKLLGLI